MTFNQLATLAERPLRQASPSALLDSSARRMDDPSPTSNKISGLSLPSPSVSSAGNTIPSSSHRSARVATSAMGRPSNQLPPVQNRRHKPRPVIYRSTNLALAAPELLALTTPEAVSATQAIRNANRVAETVRDSYRACKSDQQNLGDAIVGNDDECNAKKYERRLKMNRQSAAASRVRREAYTKALEAELVNMESSYKKLLTMLEAEQEKTRMLSQVQSHIDEHSLSSDEHINNILPVASSNVVDTAPALGYRSPPDDMFPMEPVADEDHKQALVNEAVNEVIPDVDITVPQSSLVIDNSSDAPRAEEMLQFGDTVFAAQLQFPQEVLDSLAAPLYPPVPEAFHELSDRPLGDGQSTLFDETPL